MQFLTKKEFATRVGMTTGNLTNYIKRGKVVERDDGLFDIKEDLNAAFLQRHLNSRADPAPAAKPTATAKKAFSQPRPAKEVGIGDLEADDEQDLLDASGSEPDTGDIPSYEHSERLLKYLDTEKRAREKDLLEIKKQKLLGLVVPSELVKPIFLQHNQSITTAFKNAADEIVRQFAKMKDLNPAELAEMRGFMVRAINSGVEKATTMSMAAVESLIDSYSESRGVGERK